MARNHLWYITTVIVLLSCFSTFIVYGQSSNGKVDDITERFWQWRLREAPEFGTRYGIHIYDDRVQEFTEEAFTRQRDEATDFLEEASNIDDSGLKNQNKISLQILKELLEAFIKGYKYRKLSIYNNISPTSNPLSRWKRVAPNMKLDTVDDYRTYIARLEQNAIQINNITSLMRMAVKEGTTSNKYSLTGVLEKLTTELSKPIANSTWYLAAFRDTNSFSSFPDIVQTNLTDSLMDTINSVVIPAWNAHLEFLQNVYVPNTRPEIGVASLPDGANYYQECLKWHLSVDLTAEEVHQMGLDEVARIKKLMEEIMVEENFIRGTLADFIEYISNTPSNFYQGQDANQQMLQGYRDIIREAHGKMDTVLKNVPTAKVEVRNSTNPQGSTAYYLNPPLDGSRPGLFYANVFNPETKPKFNMISLALHEAEPGHHTEAAYTMQQDLPYFRQLIEYRNYGGVPFNWLFHTAFSEGWALYAESLGEEMGMYKDNYDRFGKYNSEIFRAARLVVDTGIHAFNWTRDRAVDYMRENTVLGNETIENEVNRYISYPGQACAYKMGELKIKRLRQYAEQQLENGFDLRDFHQEVLSLGPTPLSILEDHIKLWVHDAQEKNRTNAADGNRINIACHLVNLLVALSYLSSI